VPKKRFTSMIKPPTGKVFKAQIRQLLSFASYLPQEVVWKEMPEPENRLA
jgi:hypothetical protein